jgi:hypothetical protein
MVSKIANPDRAAEMEDDTQAYATLNECIRILGVDEAFKRLAKREPEPTDIRKLLTPDEMMLIDFIRQGRIDVEDDRVMDYMTQCLNDKQVSEETIDSHVAESLRYIRDLVTTTLEGSIDFNGGRVRLFDLQFMRPGLYQWTLEVDNEFNGRHTVAQITLRLNLR